MFKNKAHNLQKRKMIGSSGLKRISDLVINLHKRRFVSDCKQVFIIVKLKTIYNTHLLFISKF